VAGQFPETLGLAHIMTLSASSSITLSLGRQLPFPACLSAAPVDSVAFMGRNILHSCCKRKQKMRNYLNSLRAARKAQRMTLAELAQKAGISVGSIGNYETGVRGISADALTRIAEVLHVAVAEISPRSPATGTKRFPAGDSLDNGGDVETPDRAVACRYPAACDLPAALAAQDARLAAMEKTLDSIHTLLGIALGKGLSETKRKAG